MKVLVNGGSTSRSDGWWAEGFRQDAGWAVGDGEEYDDFEYQDRTDAASLFSLLRIGWCRSSTNGGGLDCLEWIGDEVVHAPFTPLSPQRMVKDYTERYYVPATLQHGR